MTRPSGAWSASRTAAGGRQGQDHAVDVEGPDEGREPVAPVQWPRAGQGQPPRSGPPRGRAAGSSDSTGTPVRRLHAPGGQGVDELGGQAGGAPRRATRTPAAGRRPGAVRRRGVWPGTAADGGPRMRLPGLLGGGDEGREGGRRAQVVDPAGVDPPDQRVDQPIDDGPAQARATMSRPTGRRAPAAPGGG